MDTIRVGIIVGGIGGLALARLLVARARAETALPRISARVYERDGGAIARTQGLYIGVNASSIGTLRLLLPQLSGLEHDLVNNRNASMCMMSDDSLTKPLLSFPGDGAFVDRTNFHRNLCVGADIAWGKRFARYTPSSAPSGGIDIQFTDGSSDTVDVLVGADGAQSQVRRQRAPEISYHDLGITNSAAAVRMDSVPPSIRSLLLPNNNNSRMARWLGRDGNSIMMFPYKPPSTDGSGSEGPVAEVLWVLSWPGKQSDWADTYARAGEDTADEYSGERSIHAREALLKECADRTRRYFPAEVAEVVAATGTCTATDSARVGSASPLRTGIGTLYGPRQIFSVEASAIGSQLNPVRAADKRVVLLGDAAHGSTTHRGLGANTAIADASDLADALLALCQGARVNGDTVQHALREYEEKMVRRGKGTVAASKQSTSMIHAKGLFGHHLRAHMLRLMSLFMPSA